MFYVNPHPETHRVRHPASEEAKKLITKGGTSDEEPNMKELLSLGLVSLVIGMTTTTLFGSQDRGGNY